MRTPVGFWLRENSVAVSRNRRGRREGFHFFRWWLIHRIATDAVPNDKYQPGWLSKRGWDPWESDATIFLDRNDAEAIITGHVLSDDGYRYELEANEERHQDSTAPASDRCSECAKIDFNRWDRHDELIQIQELLDEEHLNKEADGLGLGRRQLREDQIPDQPPRPYYD